MTLSGSTHRPVGATSQLSPSARLTLAAGLLALGIGDLAVINTVLLPRYFVTSQGPGIRSPVPPGPLPDPVPAVVAVEGASAASGGGGGRVGPEAPGGRDVAVDEKPAPATAPAPATVPAPAPAPATVLAAEGFPDLLFARNTTWLSRPSRETLERVVESLKQSPDRRVVLSGHTDDVGPPDLNRALSRARARRASRYLQAHGIDVAQIEIQGLGPSPPVKGEPLSEARARNRKVEIAVQ